MKNDLQEERIKKLSKILKDLKLHREKVQEEISKVEEVIKAKQQKATMDDDNTKMTNDNNIEKKPSNRRITDVYGTTIDLDDMFEWLTYIKFSTTCGKETNIRSYTVWAHDK